MQGVGKLFLELHTHKYRHRKKGANIGWNIYMNGLCVRIFIHFMEFCRTQRHERWWLRMMMMHTQSIFRKTRLKKFIELSFVACCSLQISVCAAVYCTENQWRFRFLCRMWGFWVLLNGFLTEYRPNMWENQLWKPKIRSNDEKKRKKFPK